MKNNGAIKEKYDRPLFRSISVDQFPGKSLSVRVVFANKLKAVQLDRDCKKNMLTLFIMVYMIETKSKNRIHVFNKLS